MSILSTDFLLLVTKIYRVSNVYIEIKRKFGPQIDPQFLSLHTEMVNFMVWIIDKFGDARKVCIFAA